MAKAIMETDPDFNSIISTDEIVQGDQYRAKRICTKRDNDSKAVMDAHLEKQASHYS